LNRVWQKKQASASIPDELPQIKASVAPVARGRCSAGLEMWVE
jgi:hypothetical protein